MSKIAPVEWWNMVQVRMLHRTEKKISILITASKRSLRRLRFYTCLSVILFTEGNGEGVVSQHALQVSRPTPRWEVEGSSWEGSPGSHPEGKLTWGGLQAHTQGSPGPHPGVCVCVSQHALRQTTPLPADGYCCGQYASYWNAILLLKRVGFFTTIATAA